MPRFTDLHSSCRDDDLLSYFFIDLARFSGTRGTSRKMGLKFRPSRLNQKDEKIFRTAIEELTKRECTPKEAAARLAESRLIKREIDGKQTNPQRLHLLGHLERYLEVFDPRCGYEIFETTRYSHPNLPKPIDSAASSPLSSLSSSCASSRAATPEPVAAPAPAPDLTKIILSPETITPSSSTLDLAIRATRAYQVGELIGGLRGSVADLTDEQDDDLRDSGSLQRDFSVIMNTRKNCYQIFMGPARFVNHDCGFNVELAKQGNQITFRVVKAIAVGDEITTNYGQHYFDEDNASCLCATCEKNGKGQYFDPKKLSAKLQAELDGIRATRSGLPPRESEKPPAVKKPRAPVKPRARKSSRFATGRGAKRIKLVALDIDGPSLKVRTQGLKKKKSMARRSLADRNSEMDTTLEEVDPEALERIAQAKAYFEPKVVSSRFRHGREPRTDVVVPPKKTRKRKRAASSSLSDLSSDLTELDSDTDIEPSSIIASPVKFAVERESVVTTESSCGCSTTGSLNSLESAETAPTTAGSPSQCSVHSSEAFKDVLAPVSAQ